MCIFCNSDFYSICTYQTVHVVFAFCPVVALEKKLKAAQELSENFEVTIAVLSFKYVVVSVFFVMKIYNQNLLAL